MKILGQCEFELKMSEWTGTVVATILDLEAEFDVVLGVSWHRQWKPLADWDTLDMFINTPEGALRIMHKFGISDVRLPVAHRLTVLEDWPEELRSIQIWLKKAEKDIKGGAKAYLYFIREFEGDPDEEFGFTRGHQVDLCSMMVNPKSDSTKKGENSSVNSGSIEKGGDSSVNPSSARNPKVGSSSSEDKAKLAFVPFMNWKIVDRD